MQQSGGLLLPPVQTLVATIIFAASENAYRVLYRFFDGVSPEWVALNKKIYGFFVGFMIYLNVWNRLV